MGKVLKIIGVFVSILLLFGAIAVCYIAFPAFGNSALIVRSGSMEPTIGVGSVIVVRPETSALDNGALYQKGDIIAFRYDPNTIVTHRVTGVESGKDGVYYQTKGDANEEVDNWTVSQSDVIGKTYIHVAEFGKVFTFARSKYGFPLLIIFPAGLVILLETINIFREIRKNRHVARGVSHKSSFAILALSFPFLIFTFAVRGTSAYFADTETSKGNFFQAAATFPTSPTPTPTETPDEVSCGDINVDVSGNGVGSHNGVIIICRNNEIVWQRNRVDIRNNVNVETNTGNNTSSGNTTSTTVVQSGTSSSSATIENTSESNTTVTSE